MAILSRIWPHLLAVAAIIGAVWYIDQRGYDRAQKDEQLQRAESAATFAILLRRSEGRLATIVTTNDRALAEGLAAVRTYHGTVIQPAIEKEIADDPFLARSDARMSDGLWRSLNAALASSTCARRADGGIECPLPHAPAAAGPALGNAGEGDEP
jgi:hypothetical protein